MKATDQMAFQRDHSFWIHSHGGSGGKYHAKGKAGASKCGRARLLAEDTGTPLNNVPAVLRCKICWTTCC